MATINNEGKQQRKSNCENVTNLDGKLHEHKSNGGLGGGGGGGGGKENLGFLKHFSPI